MTAETAIQCLAILQGSYPGEAHKLSGDNGRRTASVMQAMFRKVDDAVALEAVGKCCESCDSLPSMAEIRKTIKEIQSRQALPDFTALPPAVNALGRERVLEIISKAKERRQAKLKRQQHGYDLNDREQYSHLSDELIAFARKRFSDITLARIDANAQEFKFNMESGSMLDGKLLAMRIDKYTGLIDNVVILPATQ